MALRFTPMPRWSKMHLQQETHGAGHPLLRVAVIVGISVCAGFVQIAQMSHRGSAVEAALQAALEAPPHAGFRTGAMSDAPMQPTVLLEIPPASVEAMTL